MSAPPQGNINNRILRALPEADYELLRPDLDLREMPKHMVVIQGETEARTAYFFESGLGSVLAQVPDGQTAEIGLYGWDGFAGIPLILEAEHSPHELVMQIGGSAYGISAEALRGAMKRSKALSRIMLRYVQFFLLQVAQTCVLNALLPVDERLARWLLMGHDRMPDDEVPLTHEYLAFMMGATRTTVTAALGSLADQGIVSPRRGTIAILDRGRLEKVAGAAYGVPEREYERLIVRAFDRKP